MYLLDTNVVSALRRLDKAGPQVRDWAANASLAQLYVSVMTILEIEQGILLIERRDLRQAAVLRSWMDNNILADFQGRILCVDVSVARRCAALHVPDPGAERDALIAATALVHAMTVVTRNVVDFAATGVSLLNPWEQGA